MPCLPRATSSFAYIHNLVSLMIGRDVLSTTPIPVPVTQPHETLPKPHLCPFRDETSPSSVPCSTAFNMSLFVAWRRPPRPLVPVASGASRRIWELPSASVPWGTYFLRRAPFPTKLPRFPAFKLPRQRLPPQNWLTRRELGDTSINSDSATPRSASGSRCRMSAA